MDRILAMLIRCIIWFSGFSKILSRTGLGSYEEREPGKKLKILLAGYNGARNTGADVRVIEIAGQVRRIFGNDQIELTVLTMDPENMKGYFHKNVRVQTFSPIYVLDLFRACCTHHAVIICEGSTLTSTFANALAMFYIEAAGIMQRQGKPCIAYGTEVGTMDPWLEKMARRYCADTYFITRTKASRDRLEALGLRGHTGTDTAWSFDGTRKTDWAREQLRRSGWDGGQPIIGCAVIDPFCWPVKASLRKWIRAGFTGDHHDQYKKWYFFSRSEKRGRQLKEYIDSVANAVEEYAGKNNAFVAVIGMEALDQAACDCLSGKLSVPHGVFCSADHDAFEMAGILKCLSEIVTSRYHAAVLSMDRSIPIIGISMDERLTELLAEAGMGREFLLSTDNHHLQDDISRALKAAEKESAQIRQKLQDRVRNHKEALNAMGAFLKSYLD